MSQQQYFALKMYSFSYSSPFECVPEETSHGSYQDVKFAIVLTFETKDMAVGEPQS